MQISVIICTHNPRRDYLERTLASLELQTLPKQEWEFLLVDNASSEPLANSWSLAWHPSGRHVSESEVGLTAARIRGIKEARGGLIVFVDDDNVLAPDYLAKAASILEQQPKLGAFGAGVLAPEFEVTPPAELAPRLHLLALRTVHQSRWSQNPADSDCIPWGAGLCVTKPVAQTFIQMVAKLRSTVVLGRRGKHLFSGEDDLFSWSCAELGLEFGVFTDLRIQHLIGGRRLTREYFRRLIHDHAFSNGVTRYLLGNRPLQAISLWRYFRIALHGLKNGLFSMQCQLAESKGEAAAAKFVKEQGLQPLSGNQSGAART